MDRHQRLGIGVRAPDFVLAGPAGSPVRFYAIAGGRPTALAFGPDGVHPRITDLVGRLAAREDVLLTAVAQPAVGQTYGIAPDQPTVVVLDPDLRVVGIVTGDDPTDAVVALLDSTVHRGPSTVVTEQAPVLFVPRVLDKAMRERLIRLAQEDGVETGVERTADGETGEVLDASYKRRRDHTVGDADLLRELSSVVGRRVMPEVRKAFAFRATRFEGFKIACYDAGTGGFFRPHRDNLSPATAHRVFGLTLNLNDEYEGGELRFPEYGNQLYRPAEGVALVFSGAHLHEVRDVTAGRRFVLLSFLYGEPVSDADRRGTLA